MRTLTKLMLAAALIAGTGYTTVSANTTVVTRTTGTIEDRHLSGFNAVSVSGSFDVYITQGSTESVKVEAPNNIIDKIVTEVEDGTLKIHTKNSNWNWDWSNKKIVVYVSIKDVNSISLSGSGDVFFKQGLKAGSLKLKVNGSGDITGKVDVETLESSVTGSGDITVNGRAQNSNVKVTGSGDFTGPNLVTASTAVRVVGSGDAKVNASQRIDASVAGSGDVHYTGAARDVSTSTTGSGDISRF